MNKTLAATLSLLIISSLSAETASNTYTLKKPKVKEITIYYPKLQKEWNDPMLGAYCRNRVYQELKNNEKLASKVDQAECLYIDNTEIGHFKLSESYDEKERKLTIPFTTFKGDERYPLFDKIISQVASGNYLKKDQEDETAEIEEMSQEEIDRLTQELFDEMYEEYLENERLEKEEAEAKKSEEKISEQDQEVSIESFKASLAEKYRAKLQGLPWIPKDAKLRESFRQFIIKIHDDADAKGLSIGSLTQAFKFFEENRNGIQDKTYMKEAKKYGHGAKDYNWEGISNQKQIVIVNYTLSRYEKRFFVLDLEKNTVVSTMAAHGYGSNTNGKYSKVPKRFSNVEGSGATSRGFYLSAGTYCSSGKFFGSCRGDNKANAVYLDGLSKHNWRAKERAVVWHGATYVNASSGASGNSAGCPSVPITKWTEYHQRLKKGTLFYHYTDYEYEEYVKSKRKE